ncbi:Cwf15/Cwc15 cell cycle control protein [Coprinopsis sp. MPI-PUGE-AT-0042]|nr:Cwf15/Cwc15 cell cycle control protein [Coprinopsis sp. MPI-PUGE-AT-0042]KAH6913765.1 Cwf15/Cwc15 cell cycle control protein [Coprinopsis sp. MPI-PUGE-AT-0042]
MSTAHRPTWDPAQAKDSKAGSRQFSVRDMAAHTKLKFRQVGQTSASEVSKRDLRAELLAAEREAVNKKRKAEGKPPLPELEASKPVGAITNGGSSIAEGGAEAGEESNKRRKLLQEALELDKDDDDEESGSEGEGKEKKADKGKGKAKDEDQNMSEEEEDSDEDDDDDDEDETDALVRELEKIRRERAEEKARQEAEANASNTAAREADIATSNPLLNLAAALGQNPAGLNTTKPGTFQVKKRWDDDLIFKNQAMNDKKGGEFVNDLLRTEFHKKFMSKFIK